MAQLNLYVPDREASRLRDEARKAGLPLSRYVISLLEKQPGSVGWPTGYFENVCGFLRDEPDFLEPADSAPEPVEDLDGV